MCRVIRIWMKCMIFKENINCKIDDRRDKNLNRLVVIKEIGKIIKELFIVEVLGLDWFS